ncbi:conjugal transfer protein [Pseudomonas cichorii]|nr:conjugal transfer protein [Pseudomonas cichorii]MBX8493192.1 conjugal transfer protein [Pseudomonas cichorii]
MQTRQPTSSWENEHGQLLLILAGALFLCWIFFDSFVYWTSWILYWLWLMIDFGPTHQWVAIKANILVHLANNAKTVSFEAWLEGMNQTSGILFLFVIPIVLLSSWSLALHPMLPFRSKRLINAKTLPKLVSGFSPSIIPIVAAYGPNGLKDDTSEANAWALKPEEFAENHRLITRKVLDRAAVQTILESQIGPRHESFDTWEPHERALLAVFGLQVFLNDRKAATRLLDDLNRSCMIKGLSRKPTYLPLYSLADKAFARVVATPAMEELLAIHRYKRTALAGLYGRDLRLPSARFRWLKGVDRILWYALHSADTMKVFIEGAGVLAQTRAEKRAHELALPCEALMMKKAVDGLHSELEGIGMLHEHELEPETEVRAATVPLLEAIYSPEALPADQ